MNAIEKMLDPQEQTMSTNALPALTFTSPHTQTHLVLFNSSNYTSLSSDAVHMHGSEDKMIKCR